MAQRNPDGTVKYHKWMEHYRIPGEAESDKERLNKKALDLFKQQKILDAFNSTQMKYPSENHKKPPPAMSKYFDREKYDRIKRQNLRWAILHPPAEPLQFSRRRSKRRSTPKRRRSRPKKSKKSSKRIRYRRR